ncbi:Allergen Cop c 2 [Chytriomyces cf. hyalinus JEL632]|nr:Allergen Cop c 2 [Chytriomyces cf. hyalinus JEL632]
MVQTIESNEQYEAALKSGKTVIVDWSATWCGPCKMISPVFVKLAEEFTNVVFIKVDVDEVPDAAEAAGISSMPTFQVYQDSQKVDEMIGANPAKLRGLLEKYN